MEDISYRINFVFGVVKNFAVLNSHYACFAGTVAIKESRANAIISNKMKD